MSVRLPRNTATLARRTYASSSSSASLDAYSKLNTRAWKGTSVNGTPVKNFIGGQFVASKATTHYDVYNPVSRPELVGDAPKTSLTCRPRRSSSRARRRQHPRSSVRRSKLRRTPGRRGSRPRCSPGRTYCSSECGRRCSFFTYQG